MWKVYDQCSDCGSILAYIFYRLTYGRGDQTIVPFKINKKYTYYYYIFGDLEHV